ncbi:hypothetical protein ACVW0P_002566 [Mucilaginibacter sp. UYNi724]
MKSIPCKLLLVAVLPIAFATLCYGQIPKSPVTVKSPNVAALGLYGEVPVSNFTGIPQIEVPLYTLKEKEITLPISLSYHASGFRPDQHPGWVGNGWSLQAGGVVTRTVQHLPDDDGEYYYVDNKGIGFAWRGGILSDPAQWSSANFLKDNICSANPTNYVLDFEPDVFNFNFPGLSGKFFMDHNGIYRVEGRKDIKIEWIIPNPNTPLSPFIPNHFSPPQGAYSPYSVHGFPNSFAGFIITNSNGYKYYFGGDDTSIEYSMDFLHQTKSYFIADSWYLTKIVAPGGSEVSFTYQRGPFVNQMTESLYQKNVKVSAAQQDGAWYNVFSLGTPTCYSFVSGVPPEGLYAGKLISPVYLQQINSEQAQISLNISSTTELKVPGYVYPQGVSSSTPSSDPTNPYTSDDFYYLKQNGLVSYPDVLNNLIWKKLDNITVIKKENSALIKQFNLTYSQDSYQRLTLLNVQEQSATGEQIKPYTFSYDRSYNLPGYFVHQNDHWGFWNGRTAVPFYTLMDGTTQANAVNYYYFREPDPTYALAGTLNSIVYPTGGVTSFYYEPHSYSAQLDLLRWNPLIYTSEILAGGIRIRKIVSRDWNTPEKAVTKEYFYIKNFNPASGFTGGSSGVLGGKAQYYWPNYTITDLNNNQVYTSSVFSFQSVLPASENSMGAHIGYSEVVEKNSDGSATQFKYTNFDNGHMDEAPVTNLQAAQTPFVPYNSKEFERGKLLAENSYNAAGKLVQSISYDNYISLPSEPVRAVKANVYPFCEPWMAGREIKEATAYVHYTYPYVLSQKTTTIFDLNGLNPSTSVENYGYENVYGLQTQRTVTDSRGRLTTTSFRYPFDALPATPVANVGLNTPVSYMAKRNMVATPLEQLVSKTIDGKVSVITGNLSTFKAVNITKASGAADVAIVPAAEYKLEVVQPLQKSLYQNYATVNASGSEQEQIDSRMIKRLDYALYDSRGNISTLNDNPLAGALAHNTSWKWAYNQNYPVAKVANAGQTEFLYESFEESTATGTTVGPAHTGGKYSTNPAIVWAKPNGRNYLISYWFKSGSGAWTFSGEKNYTPAQGTNTYQLTGGTAFDDVRIYPSDATMDTYAYSPLEGMTSSTDTKGKSAFFEYDGFQRLRYIKDDNKDIVKSYQYNFGIPTFFNDARSRSFQKDCGPGFIGTYATYEVPANRYTSHLSPADANQQAENDILANGQNFANTSPLAACIQLITFSFSNQSGTPYTIYFSSNSGSGPYTFTSSSSPIKLPAGTYYLDVYPPSGPYTVRSIILGSRATVSAPRTTFNNVNISAGSSDLNLTVR